ncbi:hypothetical protein [Acidiferrobacter sp.]|jgi:hypothetical protein|uniref:hypothetical protein n=1 Tax=Acidiferrobacter sp. TaxID=1872107 RepID=UPI0026286331|nr:hypothetical protein [Acidiferrobacter sp.]
MKRKWVIVGLLTASLFIVIFLWLSARGHAEHVDVHKANSGHELPQTIMAHGLRVVVLGTALQGQAGIRTQVLASAPYRPMVRAYGMILDLQPLLALRTQYAAALGQVGITRAAVTAAHEEYERLRFLNRDNQNVSTKSMQSAQSAYLSDQARLTAALADATNLRQIAMAQWGSVLVRTMLSHVRVSANALFDRQDVLLLVTLPVGLVLPSAPPVVTVLDGRLSTPIDAWFVSASPQSNASVQGETYFYRMPAHQVRIGMRVAVDVPLGGPTRQGVVVPDSAVLWFANSAWVYRQINTTRFVRQRLSMRAPVPGGWFETNLRLGQRIVTQGAELLLSQERLPQLANAKAGGGATEQNGREGSGDHREADDDDD